MQLIFDTESTIEIRNKMSAIEEESHREKFVNNMLEKCSNDVSIYSKENVDANDVSQNDIPTNNKENMESKDNITDNREKVFIENEKATVEENEIIPTDVPLNKKENEANITEPLVVCGGNFVAENEISNPCSSENEQKCVTSELINTDDRDIKSQLVTNIKNKEELHNNSENEIKNKAEQVKKEELNIIKDKVIDNNVKESEKEAIEDPILIDSIVKNSEKQTIDNSKEEIIRASLPIDNNVENNEKEIIGDLIPIDKNEKNIEKETIVDPLPVDDNENNSKKGNLEDPILIDDNVNNSEKENTKNPILIDENDNNSKKEIMEDLTLSDNNVINIEKETIDRIPIDNNVKNCKEEHMEDSIVIDNNVKSSETESDKDHILLGNDVENTQKENMEIKNTREIIEGSKTITDTKVTETSSDNAEILENNSEQTDIKVSLQKNWNEPQVHADEIDKENIQIEVKDDKENLTMISSTTDEPIEDSIATEKICTNAKNDSFSQVTEWMDVEEEKNEAEHKVETKTIVSEVSTEKKDDKKTKSQLLCNLSNTLNILSDDEDDFNKEEMQETESTFPNSKQCINLEEDDDVMLVDEELLTKKDLKDDETKLEELEKSNIASEEKCNEELKFKDKNEIDNGNKPESDETIKKSEAIDLNYKKDLGGAINVKPLLPSAFLKTCKKKLSDMTRNDLEEFCILKIVESVVDRSSLSEIKTQLKNMALNIEEYEKKATMLEKQNRDLQYVLKAVQEQQKKTNTLPITPLKITRSVGMQVLMTDKPGVRRRNPMGINSNTISNNSNVSMDKTNRNPPLQRTQKSNNQQIPVPRLVPAANNVGIKINNTQPATPNTSVKSPLSSGSVQNGVKNSSSVQKAEKRTRMQSVTVDLTDDEPPSKIGSRVSPVPPVRLVPSQNLMAPQRQPFGTTVNSPRKVYIPISGPQSQNCRSGQAVMLKSVANQGPRQRCPPPNSMVKGSLNNIRINKMPQRHPAPLPDAMKQYQPPNWKALPPAPDLKLSKVENGIVISWKIDGYQSDSYEEIASYQLYAYQETTSPPSTTLWKKIGDVKALPLPMACTLTQFMAGYKYFFAVRAVDVKSRLGPFSLPGSILLLNKI